MARRCSTRVLRRVAANPPWLNALQSQRLPDCLFLNLSCHGRFGDLAGQGNYFVFSPFNPLDTTLVSFYNPLNFREHSG